MIKIAVIGLGSRITGMLKGVMALDSSIRLAAVADPDEQRARDTAAGLDNGNEEVHFFDHADAMLEHPGDYDGVMIGTRCRLHTPMAIKVADTGLPLFLEKPVAVSFEQLHALAEAWRGREGRVVVSFPLRVTKAFEVARSYIEAGRVGQINQIQAFNNVPYGDCYYSSWYRRFEDMQGLWLQKATHDFDYLNFLVGANPLRIAAMMTQRVFGTGRTLQPPGEHEGPDGNEQITDASLTDLADSGSRFHAGIRNQDAGSAIIWYDNGVIVSYDQNFVSRRSAGTRGAIITGYNGTVKFDWFADPMLTFIDHGSDCVEHQSCRVEGGHMGGDEPLTSGFYELLKGGDKSPVDLKAGLASVAMCLAARRAAQLHTVEQIDQYLHWPAAEAPDPADIEA